MTQFKLWFIPIKSSRTNEVLGLKVNFLEPI